MPKNDSNYMKVSKRPKFRLKLPALGLVLQLFAIILLPLTILLVAITFGSLSIHQQAMRSMVGERDARLVQTAAGALNAQLVNRTKEMQIIAEMLSANASQPITTTLESMSALMPDFDAGVARFSPKGQLLTMGNYQPMWHTLDGRFQLEGDIS